MIHGRSRSITGSGFPGDPGGGGDGPGGPFPPNDGNPGPKDPGGYGGPVGPPGSGSGTDQCSRIHTVSLQGFPGGSVAPIVISDFQGVHTVTNDAGSQWSKDFVDSNGTPCAVRIQPNGAAGWSVVIVYNGANLAIWDSGAATLCPGQSMYALRPEYTDFAGSTCSVG